MGTIALDEREYAALDGLAQHMMSEPGDVEDVLGMLAQYTADGVTRPGHHARSIVEQVFGTRWTDYLEADPENGAQTRFRRPPAPQAERRGASLQQQMDEQLAKQYPPRRKK